MAIATRLRITREAFGLGQNEFARRAGIASNTYNQYEQGKNVPRLDIANQICDEYGITLDWIYRGDISGLPLHIANLLKRSDTLSSATAQEAK
jgi:transcriptional regulator with XRE-family HTH domain